MQKLLDQSQSLQLMSYF
ncbi:MAG: hypothetical protein ABF967_08145 [Lacticaseibacillus paracasei]|nr:hypothetical protein [Lacticaseibacillus paracasei]